MSPLVISFLYVSHRLSEVSDARRIPCLRSAPLATGRGDVRRRFSGSAIVQAILAHTPVGRLRASSLHRRVRWRVCTYPRGVATRRDEPRVLPRCGEASRSSRLFLCRVGEDVRSSRPCSMSDRSRRVRSTLHCRPYSATLPRGGHPCSAFTSCPSTAHSTRHPPYLVCGTQPEPAIPRPDSSASRSSTAALSDDGRSLRRPI